MKTDLLKSIYEDRYGPLDAPKKPGKMGKMANLRELAEILSATVNREKPWTYRYLNSLLNGDAGFRVSPELQTALQVMADKTDNVHPLKAWLSEVVVLSINGNLQPGDIVTGKRTRCPGCLVWFVPYSNLQKYCSQVCPGRPPKRKVKKAAI